MVRERADEFKMWVIFKIDKVAIDTVQSVYRYGLKKCVYNISVYVKGSPENAFRRLVSIVSPTSPSTQQDHCLTRTTNTFLLFFLVMSLMSRNARNGENGETGEKSPAADDLNWMPKVAPWRLAILAKMAILAKLAILAKIAMHAMAKMAKLAKNHQPLAI